MKTYPALIITCEHASAHVPAEFAAAFAASGDVLSTHRAWDPGAMEAALAWGAYAKSPVFLGQVTRLICDLNRSVGNRALWSSWTKTLPFSEKQAILSRWHHPYRQAAEQAVAQRIRQGTPVLHISVHSFTPVLNGTVRAFDLGLLYDPGRAREKALALEACRVLAEKSRAFCPLDAENPSCAPKALRVRRNAPYRGVSDSFTCFFRKRYPDAWYMGFEIEFNQALLRHGRFPAVQVAMAFDAALRRISRGPDAEGPNAEESGADRKGPHEKKPDAKGQGALPE